jgi:chemotaxis protein MotB
MAKHLASGMAELSAIDPEAIIARHEPDYERTTAWYLPWSDLMMVMFILFVVLFVFAAKREAIPKFAEQGAPTEATPVSGVRPEQGRVVSGPVMRVNLDDVGQRLEEAVGEVNPVTVSRDLLVNEGGVTVSLPGGEFFSKGGAAIAREARPVLDEIARELALTQTLVYITGFADAEAARGTRFKSAWDMASARAASVAEYFTTVAALPPERFVVQGMGQHRPLVPNTSRVNFSRNQRVEIRVTDESY